jgi:hypothetical protein
MDLVSICPFLLYSANKSFAVFQRMVEKIPPIFQNISLSPYAILNNIYGYAWSVSVGHSQGRGQLKVRAAICMGCNVIACPPPAKQQRRRRKAAFVISSSSIKVTCPGRPHWWALWWLLEQ